MEEEDGQRERSRPDGRGHVLLGILCLELKQGENTALLGDRI